MVAKAPLVKLFRFGPPQDSELTQCCQSLATIPMTEVCTVTEIDSSMKAEVFYFLGLKPTSFSAKLPSTKKIDGTVSKLHAFLFNFECFWTSFCINFRSLLGSLGLHLASLEGSWGLGLRMSTESRDFEVIFEIILA